MNQRFLKLEREVAQLRALLADRLECTELEFRPCQFPEFARKLIEVIRANHGELAEELAKVLK